MCNEPYKPEKLVRDYPLSFKRECLQSSIKPDVILVTKEKLYQRIAQHIDLLITKDSIEKVNVDDICTGESTQQKVIFTFLKYLNPQS